MADIQSVKTKIQGLINKANNTTGGNYADLTTAVDNLIGGYGQGGVSSSDVEKDVNFYDYDGTLLYSYTIDEAQALTELPDLPTQKGLICQGWNWSLEDIKARNLNVDVGATYITDDGKTRLYYTGINIAFQFNQSSTNGVVIDWGDGTTTTYSTQGQVTASHVYSKLDSYIISLEIADGNTVYFGGSSSSYRLFSSDYSAGFTKIEIGKNVTKLMGYAFYYASQLKTITLPLGITSINAVSIFSSTDLLKHLTIPNTVTTFGGQNLFSSSSIETLSLPNSITDITLSGKSAFSSCYNIKRVTIPNSILNIGDSFFYSAYGLKHVYMSNTIKSIQSSAFSSCRNLELDSLPSSLTKIGSSAFSGCYKASFKTLPENVTIDGGSVFNSCYNVNFSKFPSIVNSSLISINNICSSCYELTCDGDNGVIDFSSASFTTMNGYNFSNCWRIKKVILPATFKEFTGRYDFRNCYSMEEIDFSLCTVVPTMTYEDTFLNLPKTTIIKVPSSLLSSWKSAKYWNTIASQIVSG